MVDQRNIDLQPQIGPQPQITNLAGDLDDSEAMEVAETAIEAFEQDEKSRTEWLDKHATWIDIYYQQQNAKNPPWPDASQESIPLLTEATNQFQARAYQAFFPSRDVIQAIPIGNVDDDALARADRVKKHMEWQIFFKNKNYKNDKDALLLDVPLHGSAFTKTFRNDVKKINMVRNVRAVDLVIPYGIGPRDIHEIERKTEIAWMTINKAKFLEENGFFIEVPKPFQLSDDRETTAAQDRAQGLSEPFKEDFKEAKLIEQHAMFDLGDGLFPYIATVDLETKKLLRLVGRWEIDPLTGEEINKSWYDARTPVEYYTHYRFLPNPDGFYGLGMGHLIGQINTAVNKLLRQTIDSGTLATVGNQSGFIASALAVGKGDQQFKLGQFKSISASADDLQRSIWTPNFPGPSGVLPAMMSQLIESGQRLSTVTEALTGQTRNVQQPTTVLALIEQGLQLFSSVFERLSESWTLELEKLYRLNRLFLDQTEYFSVLDAEDNPELIAVGPQDYVDDLQITPLADPKQVTEKQKLTRAETEYQIAISNPLIANNPIALRSVTERFFKAIGSRNINEILPPVDQNPPRIDDPNLENVAFMDPTQIPPDAFMDQPHDQHIAEHVGLLESEQFTELMPPERIELVQKHIQKHNALLFAVMTGAGDEQVGGGALAEAPGDQMGVPGII